MSADGTSEITALGDDLSRRLRILSAANAKRRPHLAADLEEAADKIDYLLTENAHLRADVAQHHRETMIRDARFDPEQGPCRPDKFNDPHVWDRSAMWDDVEECTRCGTECGK